MTTIGMTMRERAQSPREASEARSVPRPVAGPTDLAGLAGVDLGRARSGRPVGDGRSLDPGRLAVLQRSAGNRAVAALVAGNRRAAGQAASPVQRQAPGGHKEGLGGVRYAAKGEIKLWERDEISKYFQETDFEGWYVNPKKASITYDGYLDQSEEGSGTSRGGVQVGSIKNTGLKFEDKFREEKGSLFGGETKYGLKGAFEMTGGKTGLSATMYGQIGPVYAEGKIFAGIKHEPDKPAELNVGNMTITGAGAGETREFALGDARYKFAGKVGISIEFEPNWTKIAATLVEDVLPAAAEAAVVAGPPLLFAAIAAMAIVEAGSKGELYSQLVGYALDSRRAAAIGYLTMRGVGDNIAAKGPISTALKASAESQLAVAAAAANLTVDSLKAILNDQPADKAPAQYAAWRSQAIDALEDKARDSVKAWRKDHAFARFWTEFPDQMREARGFYMPVMEGELSMKDVQNGPA